MQLTQTEFMGQEDGDTDLTYYWTVLRITKKKEEEEEEKGEKYTKLLGGNTANYNWCLNGTGVRDGHPAQSKIHV